MEIGAWQYGNRGNMKHREVNGSKDMGQVGKAKDV